jgi:hypothetical protein
MGMTDEQTQARIEELEREEQGLRSDESGAGGERQAEQITEDVQRLEAIRVELDRQWDYLRQRRALRAAGADPNQAAMRDPGTVEGYLG